MASMKQIKKRRKSVISTGKITKAMKLVATIKLQKTKDAATNAVPYFDSVYETVKDILSHTTGCGNKYLKCNSNGKVALIVFSANKGLAGSYNSNVIKKIVSEDAQYKFDKNNTLVYAIGNKGRDELKRRGFTIEKDYSDRLNELHYQSFVEISEEILNDFSSGKLKEIYLVYTFFKNTITHIPRVLKLIPFALQDRDAQDTELINSKKTFKVFESEYDSDESLYMNYEMDENDTLNNIIPMYISTILYGAATASLASENGARMTAMDNATKNAKELSDKLEIMYNRARQGAITQELTEIVAGANAI